MKKITIKHVNELPDWYKLEKYEAAKSLDATGWYEQLLVRNDIKKFLNSNISDVIKEQFKLLQKSPIVYVDDNASFGALFLTEKLYELKTKKPNYSLGVHRLTVYELYTMENSIENKKRTHARNYFRNRFDSSSMILPLDYPERYPFKPWLHEPVGSIQKNQESNLHVSVDMELPDSVLTEQFKQLLTQVRESSKSSLKKHKPNVESWISFGVLQYLDLSTWAEIEGLKIPNRVMADAIFPVGEGGEEVVRKTTQKIADEILTESHLNKLAAIAAQELAEQNAV